MQQTKGLIWQKKVPKNWNQRTIRNSSDLQRTNGDFSCAWSAIFTRSRNLPFCTSEWLIDWSFDWLIDRLIEWLIDWLTQKKADTTAIKIPSRQKTRNTQKSHAPLRADKFIGPSTSSSSSRSIVKSSRHRAGLRLSARRDDDDDDGAAGTATMPEWFLRRDDAELFSLLQCWALWRINDTMSARENSTWHEPHTRVSGKVDEECCCCRTLFDGDVEELDSAGRPAAVVLTPGTRRRREAQRTWWLMMRDGNRKKTLLWSLVIDWLIDWLPWFRVNSLERSERK